MKYWHSCLQRAYNLHVIAFENAAGTTIFAGIIAFINVADGDATTATGVNELETTTALNLTNDAYMPNIVTIGAEKHQVAHLNFVFIDG